MEPVLIFDDRFTKRKTLPVSPAADLFIIDQSFFALFVCWDLLVTSANISSLSIGFAFFFMGRLDRKSLSSSSDKIEDFVFAFDVVDG
jgi:hypothetical protein